MRGGHQSELFKLEIGLLAQLSLEARVRLDFRFERIRFCQAPALLSSDALKIKKNYKSAKRKFFSVTWSDCIENLDKWLKVQGGHDWISECPLVVSSGLFQSKIWRNWKQKSICFGCNEKQWETDLVFLISISCVETLRESPVSCLMGSVCVN